MSGFPKDFLWGASTAAYQVEGGLTTQWSEWEKTNAERLAQTMPARLAWLPHKERIAGSLADPENYISGRGVEHYQRFEQDFDLLQQLNMNAFRFGVEWARLEPEEGVWDEQAVEHYRRYISELKRRGIEPVLTLWHWTMPTWFVGRGGFEKRGNIQFFERYAQKVFDEFGSELKFVLTMNEPNVYAGFSYGTGDWPPEKKNLWLMARVYRNLAEAHRRSYAYAKNKYPKLQVGLPMNLGVMLAKSTRNPLNRLSVWVLSYLWNWWFLNMVRKQQDFIGVNHYFTDYRDWLGRVKNPERPVNDLGWFMEPSSIEKVLKSAWQRYHKPLLITENGLADSADEHRKWWLEETLAAIEQAQDSGVKVIGYLHWSLLDNFEWAYGWWPRFGLVAVERKTMQRTVRPSAKWFAGQIKERRS